MTTSLHRRTFRPLELDKIWVGLWSTQQRCVHRETLAHRAL
jgi:hypothetical protein